MKKFSWFSQSHRRIHSSFAISEEISILVFIMFTSFLCTTCLASRVTFQGRNLEMTKFPNYKNRFAGLSSTQRLSSSSYHPINSNQYPEPLFQVIRKRQEDENGSGGLNHHEEMKSENEHEPGSTLEEEDLSPIEQAIQQLSSPEKLLPVINNLTFIALVLLHLPAIVPTILIPLAFFCVGSLLIPIVRVNYFITHKDDGEDGRRSYEEGGSWGQHFFNLFISKMY